MKDKDIIDLLNEELIPQSQKESTRVGALDELVRRQQVTWQDLGGPKRNHEKSRLKGLSRTGLLGLVVDYCSQQLAATGVLSERGVDAAERMWKPFDRNGMPTRQGALYTSVLMHGAAYALVLPGQVPTLNGPVSQAYIRPFPSDKLFCVYGDLVDDDFPMYALRTIPQAKGPIYRLYDEESVTFIGNENGRLTVIERRDHRLGVCPVVRFSVNTDLNGKPLSEPDKHKIEAQKYENTTNDRLLAQHYNSWKIKTAEGLDENIPDEDAQALRQSLAHDTVLTGTDGVKFGTLEETNLEPLIHAEEYDRDLLAAVSQTPVWAFNGGQLVNLAAEALIEAKSGNRQKVQGFQRGFGRSIADLLRLASSAEGRADDAYDFSLTPMWKDIDDPTLAQAFDAWGKGAQQLQIPPRAIWGKLPGVSPQEAKWWEELADQYPTEMTAIAEALRRQGADSGEQLGG